MFRGDDEVIVFLKKMGKFQAKRRGSRAYAQTAIRATSGEAYDGHSLPELLERDLAQGVPLDTVAADRGYDDDDDHYLIQSRGLYSAIKLKDIRTKKKDSNKQTWFRLMATTEYQPGFKERYKIERKFGEGKQGHGLGRCRYRSRLKFAIQALLTAIVLYLKRMVKLLTGVNFKSRARVAA